MDRIKAFISVFNSTTHVVYQNLNGPLTSEQMRLIITGYNNIAAKIQEVLGIDPISKISVRSQSSQTSIFEKLNDLKRECSAFKESTKEIAAGKLPAKGDQFQDTEIGPKRIADCYSAICQKAVDFYKENKV
jgi:hypothetical protein